MQLDKRDNRGIRLTRDSKEATLLRPLIRSEDIGNKILQYATAAGRQVDHTTSVLLLPLAITFLGI